MIAKLLKTPRWFIFFVGPNCWKKKKIASHYDPSASNAVHGEKFPIMLFESTSRRRAMRAGHRVHVGAMRGMMDPTDSLVHQSSRSNRDKLTDVKLWARPMNIVRVKHVPAVFHPCFSVTFSWLFFFFFQLACISHQVNFLSRSLLPQFWGIKAARLFLFQWRFFLSSQLYYFHFDYFKFLSVFLSQRPIS